MNQTIDVVEWLQERAFRMYGPTMEAAHTKTKEWLWADEITRLRAERDALLARLAPLDDEALEAKAAAAIIAVEHNGIDDEFILEARAAIAAIRPHIEAAERERCAKVAEGFSSNRDWVPGSLWGNIRNEIAAAIRSGK